MVSFGPLRTVAARTWGSFLLTVRRVAAKARRLPNAVGRARLSMTPDAGIHFGEPKSLRPEPVAMPAPSADIINN